MNNRALRFALGVLLGGVVVGAAYVVWNEESQGRETAAVARSVDQRVRLAERSLLGIKGAQPGYVAAGQGEDFWIARVDTLMPPAREALAALRAQALVPEAQSELENAAAAFEDFEQMDRRARDYVRNGQRLLASDLVFSDGIEKVDAAVAALDRARDLELGSSDTSIRQRRRSQLLAFAGLATATLFGLVLLVPIPRERAVLPEKKLEEKRAAAEEPAADFPVGRAAPAAAAPPTIPAPAPAPEPPPKVAPAAPTIDLSGIASLCTDLGRVLDTRALPSALERAARLLDASGIVLWIADPDGRELAPIIAHGYPQNLLARLGTIAREAENVTAAAFRTGVVQTVKSDASSPGAIAAPLLTSAGPVGVMAAEVLNDGERHEATRAAAAIVAAQLATLLGPPARAQSKAEFAG